MRSSHDHVLVGNAGLSSEDVDGVAKCRTFYLFLQQWNYRRQRSEPSVPFKVFNLCLRVRAWRVKLGGKWKRVNLKFTAG